MSESGPRHRFVRTSPTGSALGAVLLAGAIDDGIGVIPRAALRRYGSFAVMLVRRGTGTWQDGFGESVAVHTHDLVVVFPGVAHWYGPADGHSWDETYLTFAGPVFELLRADGVLDPARPVAATSAAWRRRFLDLAAEDSGSAPMSGPEEVLRLAGLLADPSLQWLTMSETARNRPGGPIGRPPGPAGAFRDADSVARSVPDWVSAARHLLDEHLDEPRSVDDVAHAVHVHPDTLRRQFRRTYGMAPAAFRMRQRIAAAQELLRYTPELTNRQVATLVGFADEFHFSHRFRAVVGCSPKAFRADVRARVAVSVSETPQN